MIIWDELNKEHFICINGSEKTRIKKVDINPDLTDNQINTAMKFKMDNDCKTDGYHAYFCIFSRDPLNYLIWLGKIGSEPPKKWPDHFKKKRK